MKDGENAIVSIVLRNIVVVAPGMSGDAKVG